MRQHYNKKPSSRIDDDRRGDGASLDCRFEEHDRDLVFRTLAGEVAAFADLYRCYAGAVRAVVRSYVRDLEAGADLVHDVFVHAFEQLHTLREPDHFRAWLLAIARHAAIDHQRVVPSGRSVALDDVTPPEEPGPGPAETAHRRQIARLIRGCIDGLSERDATALSLVTQLGFGPAEVGAALDVTTGAAKVIVHRARRRLREAVLVELFVRRRLCGCRELEKVRSSDDPAHTARHVQRCTLCIALANDELLLCGGSCDALRVGHMKSGGLQDSRR